MVVSNDGGGQWSSVVGMTGWVDGWIGGMCVREMICELKLQDN
jgi:hypothetical protein